MPGVVVHPHHHRELLVLHAHQLAADDGAVVGKLMTELRQIAADAAASNRIELAGVADALGRALDDMQSTTDFLLKRAEQGQQIMLFTCHQHLAKMFEDK